MFRRLFRIWKLVEYSIVFVVFFPFPSSWLQCYLYIQTLSLSILGFVQCSLTLPLVPTALPKLLLYALHNPSAVFISPPTILPQSYIL